MVSLASCHDRCMPDHDERASAGAAEAEAEVVDAGIAAAPALPVGIDSGQGAVIPVPAEPRTLTNAFRVLQELIPGWKPLNTREKRSKANVANLDPELIAIGLQVAEVWPDTKNITGMTAEELRDVNDDIAEWADTRRAMMACIEGLDGAILTKKEQLGYAILNLYHIVGRQLRNPRYAHLRPYYEAMQRILRRRKRKAKPEGNDPPPQES